MNKKIVLNPRLVKIYELLRGFGLSEHQATILSTKTFQGMPKEFQSPTSAEIEDLTEGRR